MALLGLPILGFGFAFFVTHVAPEKIGKGRLFSRPVYRIFGHPPWTRLNQVILWGVTFSSIYFFISVRYYVMDSIQWGIYLALYLDDYITGDDEKWKRFWDRVRNTIKWKMELPQPVAG